MATQMFLFGAKLMPKLDPRDAPPVIDAEEITFFNAGTRRVPDHRYDEENHNED